MGYEIKGEDVLGHKLYITVENTWKSSPEEINRDLGSLKGVKIMTHVNPDYMDTEHKNIELLNM